jgi:hypothetical protein
VPRFTTASLQDVAPKRQSRQPSGRAQTRQRYQDALRKAIIEQRRALIVELEEADNPLTIRNRIKKAAEVLGLENLTIRRRGDRIVAYQAAVIDEGAQTGEGSPAILERKGIAS